VAALGVIFANGTNFPSHWSGNDTLFIAEHGSWNRNIAIGYRIALVQVYSTNEAVRHEVFASGWLQNENTPEQYFWGRPNHLLFLQDGSMLVSDDFASAVYRITYSG
jgi:glucose/arabinose dehydrogenase